jgi:two-component system CheB/CheR fusion protein
VKRPPPKKSKPDRVDPGTNSPTKIDFGKQRSVSGGSPSGDSFPVVGVGASAGGLEAFSELVANLPLKTGMAFVLVQHLDPAHGSALQEILSRRTRIPVREVVDGMKVQRDHIYVIPANADLALEDGVLHLMPRVAARGVHKPIDSFFRSLAEQRRDRSIAVILSGTASDGTAGCSAIKAAGGITFAQDDKTAKYGSMPESAALSGCVDFVLPPRAIAAELVRIGKHPYVAPVPGPVAAEPEVRLSPDDLQRIFTMVRQAMGVDFTHYKQSTVQRRICGS